MSIRKYGRYWALYDDAGALVCICLYKKGEAEVFRRLQQLPAPPVSPTHTHHKAQGDRILIPCNDVDRRLESDLITGS